METKEAIQKVGLAATALDELLASTGTSIEIINDKFFLAKQYRDENKAIAYTYAPISNIPF